MVDRRVSAGDQPGSLRPTGEPVVEQVFDGNGWPGARSRGMSEIGGVFAQLQLPVDILNGLGWWFATSRNSKMWA